MQDGTKTEHHGHKTGSMLPQSLLLPDGTPLLMDWKDLQPIVRFSRATLHREVNAGRFPKPITVSAQKTAWIRHDVEKWVATRIAVRDKGVAA